MPQMAPYNWMILFLFFSLIMIYMISYIYFYYTNSPSLNFKKLMPNKFFWKW